MTTDKIELSQKCFASIYMHPLQGLTPGKIWLSAAGNLECSIGLNQQPTTLFLSSSTKLLEHTQSKAEFEATRFPLKQGFYLKISCKEYSCYLVFDDERVYKSWLQGLTSQIKSANNQESSEEFGCIYDLAIIEGEGDSWIDIKLTAVKSNMSSSIRYFFFDLTQPNLYSSVREVLFSVEGHLDLTNTLILKEFLLDIVRFDFLNKSSGDIIKASQKKTYEFSSETNQIYKSYYRSLQRNDLTQHITDLLQKSSVVYDKTSNVLKVLEIQKLALQIQLQDFFLSSQTSSNQEAVLKLERSLELVLMKKPQQGSEENANCLNRTNVCNCVVF